MSDFMKKPCSSCPFRHDVKPFLTPERGEELANSASNPYNTFHCHKTLEYDDDDDNGDGDTFIGEHSKLCAGFLTLQHNENGSTAYDDDGFEPSPLVYSDSWEMEQAYQGDE